MKLLAHDHAALDKVLRQLLTCLDRGDLEGSHSRLDLFWARLAVHIRAEHLHLFPAVVDGLSRAPAGQTDPLTVSDVQTSIEQLQADHNFFMHGLAQAIAFLRDLLKTTEQHSLNDEMMKVRDAVIEIKERLVLHNELEENHIYRWATDILNEQEKSDLATRIDAELANRPSRFSPDAWSNQPAKP